MTMVDRNAVWYLARWNDWHQAIFLDAGPMTEKDARQAFKEKAVTTLMEIDKRLTQDEAEWLLAEASKKEISTDRFECISVTYYTDGYCKAAISIGGGYCEYIQTTDMAQGAEAGDGDGIVEEAEYTSVWDGGAVKLTTRCFVNYKTGEVFDIEPYPGGPDVSVLDREYVTVNGKEWPVVPADGTDGNGSTPEGAFWRV